MNKVKEFLVFLAHIYEARSLLLTLVKNNFRKQYLGSYLGLLWAFIQPLVFMLVIWFVFDKGFRAGPKTDGTPFFLWLMCGMIPWFFIANTIVSGTGAVVNNVFMVKKVAFRVSVLPLVEIGSALLIHLVLLVFLVLALLSYGYAPTLYWLQLPYYILCSVALLLGLTWLTSAIRVFIKDIGNFVSVLIQIGFWATPIFWSLEILPEKWQTIIQLNPAFYIVNGYRDTFVTGVWFWARPELSLYYCGLALMCMAVGALIFRRLRPHFGDVL